jgi:hypothetical protein
MVLMTLLPVEEVTETIAGLLMTLILFPLKYLVMKVGALMI